MKQNLQQRAYERSGGRRRWPTPRGAVQKLIVLSFLTLGSAFALLWACAAGVIGPSMNHVDWGHGWHFLQSSGSSAP
ncbi:MAG: hypothetical protein R3A47_08065 [Polyangiales bacterium]